MADLLADARAQTAGGDYSGAIKTLEQARQTALKRKSVEQLRAVKAAGEDVAARVEGGRAKKAAGQLLYAVGQNISMFELASPAAASPPPAPEPTATTAPGAFCSSCGTALAGARFCPSCGTAAGTIAPVATPASIVVSGGSASAGGVARGTARAVGKTIKWALILGTLVIVAVIIIVIVSLGKAVDKANKTAARVAPLMGQITIGESESQVRSVLGKPDSTQSDNIGGQAETYWYYGTLSTKGTWQLVFTNDRLTDKNKY